MTRRFPAEEWARLVSERRRSLAPPEHYVRAVDWPAGARVVDLGCGPGFFTPALQDVATVTAIDAQPAMLAVLRDRVTVPAVAASLEALPFADGAFDVAWCAFVLHEVPDLASALAEARRVLAPGGRLVALDWDPASSEHGPPAHERIAADTILRAMQGAGFAVDGPRAVTDCQYLLVGTPLRSN